MVAGQDMEYKDQSDKTARIAELLRYQGPSTRQERPMENWVGILDYRNSDENERNISVLLSSQKVPFHIERPDKGWSQPKLRLIVTVPREHLETATVLLSSAVEASAVERIEGLEGLPGPPRGAKGRD
jgi:hypothetical protein